MQTDSPDHISAPIFFHCHTVWGASLYPEEGSWSSEEEIEKSSHSSWSCMSSHSLHTMFIKKWWKAKQQNVKIPETPWTFLHRFFKHTKSPAVDLPFRPILWPNFEVGFSPNCSYIFRIATFSSAASYRTYWDFNQSLLKTCRFWKGSPVRVWVIGTQLQEPATRVEWLFPYRGQFPGCIRTACRNSEVMQAGRQAIWFKRAIQDHQHLEDAVRSAWTSASVHLLLFSVFVK